MATFRSVYRWMVPTWINDGEEGSRVLHTLATMLDVYTQRLLDGLEARFPTRAGDSALILLGKGRAISRGRSETAAHYAQRLIRWRWPKGHRVRGNAYALLEQIWEYWGGIQCWVKNRTGGLYTRTLAGVESYALGAEFVWDSLACPPNWARFWIVLDGTSLGFAAHPTIGDPGFWGDAAWGDGGYTLGQTGVLHDDVIAMRRLVYSDHAWRPAGVRPEWAIVSLTGALPTPDATWENWSKLSGGVQVQARSSMHRYWALDPALNTYAGDPDSFCLSATMPGGGTYAGDPDVFPADTTLWGGTVYAGDIDVFPASVQLFDDGTEVP
jgi:hypothetical protein